MAQAKKEETQAKKEETQAKKEETQAKKYIVTVENNPKFVGIGAGGVQFSNGKAEITSERMARWFREHPGYGVKEAE